jgi:exosortase
MKAAGSATDHSFPLSGWFAALALWGPLLWRWQETWRSDAAYAYGWAVPFLAAYLFWLRLADAPGPTAPSALGATFAGAAVVLGTGLTAAALPFLESSPLWPALAWISAGSAILASLGFLAWRNGWRWALHFVVPLAFMGTALRWPGVIERPLMTELMELNAVAAAEAVSWLGRPALVRGTVIEVVGATVGVDEACSGIRSLQTVIMVALFLGELLRFSGGRRLGLLALAIGAALVGNIARTGFLTWQAAAHGTATLASWHDPVGNVVLVATLGAVLAGVFWLGQPQRPAAPPGVPSLRRAHWPSRVAATMAVLLLSAELATQAWFRRPNANAAQSAVQWQLVPPATGWQRTPVAETTARLLRASRTTQLQWRDTAESVRGVAFLAHWDRDPADAGLAELHDPTICLPHVGARLEANLGLRRATVDGVEIEFSAYRFGTAGERLWVWFCLWDGFSGAALAPSDRALADLLRDRLRRVGSGRRRLDLAHLTFAVQGASDDRTAEARLREAVASTLVATPRRP